MKNLANKLFILACLSVVSFTACAKNNDKNINTFSRQDTYALLEMFGKILEEAEISYVEPIDKKKAIEAGINGMLSSLDPHSSFLNEKDFEDMKTQTKGEFGGLGIEITSDQGLVRIISPIDDTPAFKAGLKPGDYITHIDGVSLLGMSLSDAVEKMRGKPGTAIDITIRRKGMDAFDVNLTRDIITIRSVRWEEKGDVGYIRISSFNDNTTDKMKEAIADLKDKIGKDLKGFVLDLRNNPGGLLNQAVSVSDLFLNYGEIVSTRGRELKDIQRYNATDGDIIDNMPIVVLINDGSASAAEIVSGALQDHKRAIVVGVKSYGKASVQTVMPLATQNKSIPEYGIRLTTARYYTPSGHSIQAKGITPDIIIKPATIEELPEAFSRSESEFYNALENEEDNSDDKSENKSEKKKQTLNKKDNKKDTKKDINPFDVKDEEKKIPDYQLDRAIDILRSIAIYNDNKKSSDDNDDNENNK